MTSPMIPENPSTFYRLCLSLFASALVAFGLAACTGSSKAPSLGDEPTEASTPEPTPVPADMRLASNLERNGQYDEAEAAYTAVVAEGSSIDRQWARVALVRLALARGDYETAGAQLKLLDSTMAAGRAEADFLLARASPGTQEAIDSFQRYIDEGGVAAASAHSELASELIVQRLYGKAITEAQKALDGLPESLQASVILSVAQSLENAQMPAAVDWYQRLYDESESDSDKALALERIGLLRKTAGTAGWEDALQEVVAAYPITDGASSALETLLVAGEPVDAYAEALVYYRHFQNDDAMQTLRRYLASEPAGAHAAAAHYYLAALDERLGENDAALQEYGESLEIDPAGDLADDAYWWSGLIFEKQSRWDEASDAYGHILAMSRMTEWAEDAGFRQGLVFYKQERYQDAANAWRSFASETDDAATPHLLFWSAKAEMAGGDKAIAVSHLRELATGWPLDYYGLRAASLLAATDKKATPLPAVRSEEQDIQSWLIDATGQSASATVSVWLDPRWQRGQELLSVGFPRSAAAEFRDLMWSHAGDPSALWTLSQAFRLLGQTEMSSRSAELVLEAVSPELRATAPRVLLETAYPQDYMTLLESAQRTEGVSPNVMLALMRQESFFDPLAGSGAGAMGLTQVIPATGQEIASDLGISNFDNRDLFRPVVSIGFGGHYLEKQLAAFDGNLYYALAAYNAGPGAAENWRDAAGDDIDMFLEQVDIGEANLYVRLVMENLAVYRYLYEDAARPSLPP